MLSSVTGPFKKMDPQVMNTSLKLLWIIIFLKLLIIRRWLTENEINILSSSSNCIFVGYH